MAGKKCRTETIRAASKQLVPAAVISVSSRFPSLEFTHGAVISSGRAPETFIHTPQETYINEV